MFKRILWATDGSEGADEALVLARGLAEEGGAELLVVHYEEIGLWGGGAVPVHANEDQLKAKIDGQVAELSKAGVRATLELTRAEVAGAAHSIARAAESLQADLVVVGTRGHTRSGG